MFVIKSWGEKCRNMIKGRAVFSVNYNENPALLYYYEAWPRVTDNCVG